MKKIGVEKDNIVVEGWLSCYCIPDSIKVFLDVKIDEAAKRVFKDQRPDEEKKSTVKEVKDMLKKRLKETIVRYKKYYKFDFLDKKFYDLVIDTTKLTQKEVVNEILNFINNEN